MAKIPQVIIYRNDKGETILEIPSSNGARRTQVLDYNDAADCFAMIENALDIRENELADAIDAEELERSMRAQRRSRQISGITETDVQGSKINASAIHRETYCGRKIQIHKISDGGVVAYISGRLMKTLELDMVARFSEIAYAIRAAHECVDKFPDEYPHLIKAINRDTNGTIRKPRDEKIYDLDLENLD